MKTLISIGFALVFAISIQAQDNSTEGIIEKISMSELVINHLSGKVYPKKGQTITIDKRFQNGAFSGTHSLAEGTVSESSAQQIQIKVSKYTSTLEENGVRRPMAKIDDHVVIKWSGEGLTLGASGDTENDQEKLDKQVAKAQELMDAAEYKEAVEVLEPLIETYNQCYGCRFLLGHCYYEVNEEEKAIYQLTQVIDNRPEKYPMAYIWRARAYADVYPHQYKKAIEDYRSVLKYADDAKDKVYILYQIANLEESIEDFDAACAAVKEIQTIEGENADNKDFYNHFCLNITVPSRRTARFDATVVKQSTDLNSISVKISAAALNCYYSSFDEKPTYQTAKNIKAGTVVSLGTCEEKISMAYAVAKVKSIKDDIAEIEVLYWTNKMNGRPWRQEFDANTQLSFSW